MSVIRVNHQKNYVVINKDVLENKNLSFKAKGLWAYCMSRPNDWEFHVSHLATVSKGKEDSVYSAIKELEKEGYIRKIQKFEKGRFGTVDYEISEIQIILPLAGFPDAVFPDAGNPALLSNDCLPSIEKEEVVCYPTAVAADFQRSLSKEEIKKNSVDAALRGLKLPSILKKQRPDGHEVTVSLEEMFLKSVQSKKDWKTSEIHEAWKILADYSGLIREPFSFIEGTIKNFRTKEKCEFMKTGGKKEWKSKNVKITQQLKEDKPQSSVKDTVEHPSLGSLLEKAGIQF